VTSQLTGGPGLESARVRLTGGTSSLWVEAAH
jgi:hypothetical protein